MEKTLQPEHATRQRILDAASSAFAAAGFSGARVDEIARRAGVNKALLYYHVGNKQALYTAVLMRNFDRVEAALADVMKSGGSARDRLTAVIATVTRTMQKYPDHPRIVLRELASAGGHLEPAVLARMMRVLGSVRHLLSDGVRSGEFRATEPVMTHLTMIGASLILNAVAPLRGRAAEIGPDFEIPDDDAKVAPFLTDLLLNGIAAPGSGENT
jgi:AcrR family transcriptional regulator